MSAIRQMHIIINPAAGQAEPVLHELNRLLQPHDIHWRVSLTQPEVDTAQLAHDVVAQGIDAVAVYGGDGTVRAVVNGLRDADVPLAILPGGTGNAVAQKLGIPLALDEATRLLIDDDKRQRRALDIGEVHYGDDHCSDFILRTSVGLYNDMLDSATRDLKQQYGDLAYMMAGIRTIGDLDDVRFHLTIDGDDKHVDGHTCMIANIATVGGFVDADFAPQVDPSDGELDVFVFDARSEDILAALRSYLATDLSQFPHHWRAQEITLHVDPPKPIFTDGERLCETDIRVQVVPRAVEILVPTTDSSANQPENDTVL